VNRAVVGEGPRRRERVGESLSWRDSTVECPAVGGDRMGHGHVVRPGHRVVDADYDRDGVGVEGVPLDTYVDGGLCVGYRREEAENESCGNERHDKRGTE